MNDLLKIAGWADPMMIAKLEAWKRAGGAVQVFLSESRPGMAVGFSTLPIGSALVLRKGDATTGEKHVWIKSAGRGSAAGWIEKRDYKEYTFADVRYIEKMSVPYIEDLAQKKIVVLRNNDVNRLVILRCPCGCGADMMLQLKTPIEVPGPGVLWEMTVHDDETVDLDPSVVNTQCGTHFIVENSKTLI